MMPRSRKERSNNLSQAQGQAGATWSEVVPVSMPRPASSKVGSRPSTSPLTTATASGSPSTRAVRGDRQLRSRECQ